MSCFLKKAGLKPRPAQSLIKRLLQCLFTFAFAAGCFLLAEHGLLLALGFLKACHEA